MTRRYIHTDQLKEPVQPPSVPAPPPESISIDALLNKGLRALYGIMRAIENDVNTGAPSRETVMNLKDAMGILKELKKEEKEILEGLSDDELEQMIK